MSDIQIEMRKFSNEVKTELTYLKCYQDKAEVNLAHKYEERHESLKQEHRDKF